MHCNIKPNLESIKIHMIHIKLTGHPVHIDTELQPIPIPDTLCLIFYTDVDVEMEYGNFSAQFDLVPNSVRSCYKEIRYPCSNTFVYYAPLPETRKIFFR